MVIFPNVCLIIFGKKIGESIYSYYWVAFSISNFFQFAIALLLTSNSSNSEDYSHVLLFFTVCVIGSAVACWKETLQGPWNNSLDLVEIKRTQNRRKYSSWTIYYWYFNFRKINNLNNHKHNPLTNFDDRFFKIKRN